MAKGTLRRFDVQSRYGFILSVVSVVPFAAAAIGAWQRYDAGLAQIVYGARGYFLPVFVACVLVSMVPSAVGCLLGFNSAGQRRNEKPARSWAGFFLGGTVFTFDLILLIAFYMLRLEKSG